MLVHLREINQLRHFRHSHPEPYRMMSYHKLQLPALLVDNNLTHTDR